MSLRVITIAVLIACTAFASGWAPASATPYPSPQSAHELACDLSPALNPDYASWWNTVPHWTRYRTWFRRTIVPRSDPTDDCAADVSATFWSSAVPDGWVPIRRMPQWPAPEGGYFTQKLWLYAVPKGWAPVPDIGGWPSATGSYYAQWLWLHAIPEGWAPRPGLTLGHDLNPRQNQSYYRHFFWEYAVPGDLGQPVRILPGRVPATQGYYAQWLWLRAIPEGWAPTPSLSIGGVGGRGFYDFIFYHQATAHDFAWRDGLSLGGSAGAGYYDYWFHTLFGTSSPHYQDLLNEASGYLANAVAQGPLPVSRWFAPDAHAVVILTFDTEGRPEESCAIASVLRAAGVRATFFMLGLTSLGVAADPAWASCLAGFDLGNHTNNHTGTIDLVSPDPPLTSLLDTLLDATQRAQVILADSRLRLAIPTAAGDSFRTPICDRRKSFDAGVARMLLALDRSDGSPIIRTDSSVLTVSPAAVADGVVPPLGLRVGSLEGYPYPFVLMQGLDGRRLVELPFSYPSDAAASTEFGLDPRDVPPSRTAPGFAVNVWKDILDETYDRGGVMVVLMHPWIQAYYGQYPDGLADLVAYAKTKEGLYFSTVHEARDRYAVYRDASAP